MDINLFNSIVEIIREFEGLPIDCLSKLINVYPDLTKDTLASILSHEYKNRMKAVYVKNSATKNRYWKSYLNSSRKFERPGIILRIAKAERFPPCLIAKLILEVYFEELSKKENGEKSTNLKIYMRNTSLIPDMNLAYEVFLCNNFDNLYSPVAEMIRTSVGQQYEVKLQKEALQMGLAFRDEEYLRKYGYDKTPDIKLEVPVSIDGFIINWIESKALFGAEGEHNQYTTNQYLSYWNRFGAGLVIYWFGYVNTITDKNNKCFLIRDHLPNNIVHIANS